MAGRYSAEFLLHLRQSPLCVKPLHLPPPEEWMGPPPETIRNQQKTGSDRTKSGEGLPLTQDNRRPPHERNGSRNTANPDEIILGPPRTSFASATSMRNPRTGELEKGFRDSERQDRADRFNFRNRTGDLELGGRDAKDPRSNGFRRRGDQDQDSEGWSTVKPRKSFGHEGAERFHGRMGGVGGGTDRFGGREDRRLRDRDDREGGERRTRNFDQRSHDQDGDEPDTPRRNGLARGKSESWFRDNATPSTTKEAAPMTQRERIDRAKSWRDRDPEDKPSDRYGDRNDRNYERRWDRDRHARVEHDPEWLDEPLEEKAQGHTEEDFKKFMEEMKAAKGGGGGLTKSEEKPSMAFDKPAVPPTAELEHKVVSAPAIEQGPDKFFAAFAGSSIEVGTPSADAKDAVKPKTAKSSRFMAFLAPQEESRARTEPPTPAAGIPPVDQASAAPQQNEAEKAAFALLIQKLHKSGIGSAPQTSAPPTQAAPNQFPESPFQELQQKNSAVASPEPFQQYVSSDRRDDPRMRTSQHQMLQDILSPRPMGIPAPHPPASRPEQALQDLLAQRHHLPPNQTNVRAAQNVVAVNRNTEFLMGLMQSHRDAPEPPRTEQVLLRMQQPPAKQMSLGNMPDREQDYGRDRSASQRQQLRGQGGPPGFMDDNQFRPPGDMDARPPPQPTQILQRPPPPPGLDHQMHPFLMGGVNPAGAAGAGQMPPQRPMIPPPGILNNGPRNMPMPGMFPPNFPNPHGHGLGGPGGPGNFPPGPPHPSHAGGPPPPDGMVGPPPPPGPPRNMQPPPGFFGGPPPPPGFMPPPGMGGGGGFQGPDGPQPPNAGPGPGPGPGGPPHPFGGLPSPFERMERMGGMDRRGMMPPGGYRGP